MAKKQFLDKNGLNELVNHVPILVAGRNIMLTPDETKTNKITISTNGGFGWTGTLSQFNDAVSAQEIEDNAIVTIIDDENEASFVDPNDFSTNNGLLKLSNTVTQKLSGIDDHTSQIKNIVGGDVYESGKTYNKNDACIYDNKIYICKETTTELPTDTTYWKEISLRDLNISGNYIPEPEEEGENGFALITDGSGGRTWGRASSPSWTGSSSDWNNDTGSIPKADLPDKAQVIIDDDYNSNIKLTVASCENATDTDVAGAKVINDLSQSLTNQYQKKLIIQTNSYKMTGTGNILLGIDANKILNAIVIGYIAIPFKTENGNYLKVLNYATIQPTDTTDTLTYTIIYYE